MMRKRKRLPGLNIIEECYERARRRQIWDESMALKDWHELYERLRLRCKKCDGYLVYSKPMAFCCNTPECQFKYHRRSYVMRKAEIVEGLILNRWPLKTWPYLLLEEPANPKRLLGRRWQQSAPGVVGILHLPEEPANPEEPDTDEDPQQQSAAGQAARHLHPPKHPAE
jgi:hypothetical protein